MAVIDRINRIGSSRKQVVTGPAELVGPRANTQRFNFSSVTRISGSVDLYEITDGSGANEGTYTVQVRPLAENGFQASLRGVGAVALVSQADGVANPAAAASCLARKVVARSNAPVQLGPVSVATGDRFYVVVERKDPSALKYQLVVDLVADVITIATQPASVGVTAPAATSFTVSASSNDGGTLSFQWQLSTNGGTSFANLSNGGVYSGATTGTLAISDSTGLSGNQYRVVVSSTGGAPAVTSDAGTLTLI
jgi:hypothetical protein